MLSTEPGYLATMAFARDGQTAIVVERKLDDLGVVRSVQILDPVTGVHGELPAFGEPGTVALDASGTVAVRGDREGILRVGLLSGEQTHLLVGHEGPVEILAISPDRRWIASVGEDNTLRLWPMPDLSKPPLHTLPHDELIAKLKSLTNIRVVRDPGSAEGWKVDLDPFPGWKDVPEWN